jgi:hypothetical protein
VSRFLVFPLLDSFWAESRAPGFIFHVLGSLASFGQYRGRRVQFSCFTLPNSFSVVQRVSGPVLMLCAPTLIFDGTEGLGSRFHVLRSQTHFQRYRGCRDPF